MNWLTNVFLVILALMIIPRIFGRIRIWLLAKEIQFVDPQLRVISDSEISQRYLPIYKFARLQLPAQVPFIHKGTVELIHERPAAFTSFYDYFVSYDGRVVAIASNGFTPASEPFMVIYRSRVRAETEPLEQVTFGSQSQDRAKHVTLETMNRTAHFVFKMENTQLADSHCDGFRAQFQFHLDRIDELPVDSLVDFSNWSIMDLMELEREEVESLHSRMVTDKDIQADSSGIYRLSAAASWRFSSRIIRGQRAISTAEEPEARDSEGESPDINPEVDLAEFTRLCDVNGAVAARRSQLTKWLILLLSGVGFFIAFGFWLGFLVSLILLVVVFVHELGHISAMALFGYRNRQVLFIPFFGAAAIGEKSEAPAWQQLVVLFMGPIPGLVIGMICLYISAFQMGETAFELQRETLLGKIASLTLVLNYLNLIPLGFLDGGRIVQTLFFSRFARARFAFQLLSALAFLALAILLMSWIIGVIAAISLLSLPAQWRFGSILKQVEGKIEPLAEFQQSPVLQASVRQMPELQASELQASVPQATVKRRLEIFRVLRESLDFPLTPRERHETAKQLFEYVEAKRAGVPTIVVGTTLYLVSLVLPIVLFLMLAALRG